MEPIVDALSKKYGEPTEINEESSKIKRVTWNGVKTNIDLTLNIDSATNAPLSIEFINAVYAKKVEKNRKQEYNKKTDNIMKDF
ncbi:MAG: hypothetical protein HY809_06200 [Nitrospirae bacterium]|nr:hypothetical protein [Nitrospirota bacterium]